MKYFWLAASVALLASMSLDSSGPTSRKLQASAAKISKGVFDNLGKDAGGTDIIVVLKAQADLTGATQIKSKNAKGKFVYDALRTIALQTQGDLVNLLTARSAKFKRFYISNMIAVKQASSSLVQDLASREDVGRIIYDPRVKMVQPFRVPAFTDRVAGIEGNITYTGAPKVWDELKVRGAGIVIAGQDTGVQWDHPALKGKYRGYNAKTESVDHAYNWHDAITETIEGKANKCGYNLKEPCDDDQHGTHTMGTMLGDDGNGNQVGMAPDAQFMACRNMDAGTGRPTTYIDCFEFFLAPYAFGKDPMTEGDPTKAPHVVNNSWGCPKSEGCEGSEMLPVLKAMASAGIMIVVSAGNDGPGCSSIADQPATHTDETLAVGAMNHRTGQITDFSSRGPSLYDNKIGPDVSAPGEFIRSAVPGNGYEGGWSGTSMAGPHVVGMVALLWAADPSLVGNITDTVNLVRASAIPKMTTESCGNIPGSQVPNNTYGYGNIDVYKAVKSRIR